LESRFIERVGVRRLLQTKTASMSGKFILLPDLAGMPDVVKHLKTEEN
jgi:hypothetical protein